MSGCAYVIYYKVSIQYHLENPQWLVLRQSASGAPVSCGLPPNRTTVEPTGAANMSCGCDDGCEDDDGDDDDDEEDGGKDEDDG